MDRAFLVIACLLGLLGVALGAFGSHALRSRLSPEQLAQFETGVRYQLWHALSLFVVVWFRTVGPDQITESIAGVTFIAGVVLFSGSLYLLATTGVRRWGAFTPVGGVSLLVGWACLAVAGVSTPFRF